MLKWLLFSAPVLFALQWWVISTRGEPYPAIVLPAFGAAPHPSPPPRFELRSGDALLATVTLAEMFPAIPRAQRQVIARLHLQGELSQDVRAWLVRHALPLEAEADRVDVVW